MELQWFTDILFLRKQIFQFNGVLSEPKPVYTGVPQGSILRPLLFVVIFNCVRSRLSHCKIITYANDTVFLHPQVISMRYKATFPRTWIIFFVIMKLTAEGGKNLGDAVWYQ